MTKGKITAFVVLAGIVIVGMTWRVRSKPAAPPPRRNFDPLATLSGKELDKLIAGRPSTKNMILIPYGEFIMGSDDGDQDERPVRKVILDAYYIDRTEVTNAQYKKFIEATGHRAPKASLAVHLPFEWQDRSFPSGRANHPVVLVSWEDALAYALWAGKRLPTEAEWEKAARGNEARKYPWGDRWSRRRCNSSESALFTTTPVGNFPEGVSPFGGLDMAGNVWEWTRSLWGEDLAEPAFKYPYDPKDGRENLR
ncbi:MAG: SUMF1/EgtB/PvdO family nonheme iron enzyme, partial [Planctomycetota bacterium]|nr:SUMF1/EgtB/PvdO family nonheme iron enzyme [Planctomycetota bacterium]